MQRYLKRIKECNPEINHTKGVENVVVDALSRPPLAATMYVRGPGRYEMDLDYEEILDSEDEILGGEMVEVEEEIID